MWFRFTCIGLGDSSYPKYNFTAKKLHKRLVQLGAEPVMDLCLCDEQERDGGSEAAFSRWTKEFFGDASSPLISSGNSGIMFSKYKIVYLNGDVQPNQLDTTTHSPSEIEPFLGELVENKRVTSSDHWQDVRLIEIECGSTDRIKYQCGDVCVMRPSNTQHNIDKFLQIFEHLNLGFTFKSVKFLNKISSFF